MKRIGLISDTHAHWDDRYAEFLADCDEIWHLGDAGTLAILNRLKEIAPVRAVYGNADGQDIRREYPQTDLFRIEDVTVLLKHIGGYPGHYDRSVWSLLKENRPDLFVCGHSHILKVQYDKSHEMLYVNPGAAGLQGWQAVRTMIRFTIDGKSFRDMEVYEIPLH